MSALYLSSLFRNGRLINTVRDLSGLFFFDDLGENDSYHAFATASTFLFSFECGTVVVDRASLEEAGRVAHHRGTECDSPMSDDEDEMKEPSDGAAWVPQCPRVSAELSVEGALVAKVEDEKEPDVRQLSAFFFNCFALIN